MAWWEFEIDECPVGRAAVQFFGLKSNFLDFPGSDEL